MQRTVSPPMCCATSIMRGCPSGANGECFIYLRQAAAVKSNVHNRTCYLYHGTFAFHSNFLTFYARLPSARKRTVRVGIGRRGCGVSAALPCVPPTISVISCVMADCRARL